jgi:hypothetical protein
MQQVSMGGAIKNDLWITDVERYRAFMFWFALFR